MRFVRSAATTLTLAGAATLAAFAVPALTTPAFAQGPSVSVSPSTAAPGASVTFTITCDTPTANSATFYGTTLGLAQISMNPTRQPGKFIVTVVLPTSISPGLYTPSLACSDDTMRTASLTVTSTTTAPVITVTPPVAAPGDSVTVTLVGCSGAPSATLNASSIGLSSQIQMQRIGSQFTVVITVPTNTSPAQYPLTGTCNGQSATASLTINPFNPSPPPTIAPVTGDGATSTATGGPFATAGLALLGGGGIAAGVGAVYKRRRSGGGSRRR